MLFSKHFPDRKARVIRMAEQKNIFTRYQLRQAAGMYFLIDCEQPGLPYRRPMTLNEVGARIWELLSEGRDREQIARILSEEYEVELAEVSEDVALFCRQLKEQKIL